MRRKSDKSKFKEKRGTGTGKDYKPWIEVGEFGSNGTATVTKDWKTGRQIHLMSQTELYVWAILNWMEDIADIREQYPLDINKTLELSRMMGIEHPSKNGEPIVMTTDFVITIQGHTEAVSVKYTMDQIFGSERAAEKCALEKIYWREQGIPFELATRETINEVFARNILDVIPFYNIDYFSDEITFLKFLIARKYLKVNMTEEPLNFPQILTERKDEIEKWKNSQLMLKMSC